MAKIIPAMLVFIVIIEPDLRGKVLNKMTCLLSFRCHVNTFHWTQWRSGLFVSAFETGIRTFCIHFRACLFSHLFLSVLSQLVSSCVTRCWTATQQRCLCGSWLCRAPPASVCSGMKSSTSTKRLRICLWTSEGKSIYRRGRTWADKVFWIVQAICSAQKSQISRGHCFWNVKICWFC